MGNFYDKDGVYHEVEEEYQFVNQKRYKGSSTKEGGSHKEIAKRRKKNKNKKTHRR